MEKRNIKYRLVLLMLMFTIMDAYCLFAVDTFPVTISWVFMSILLVFNIINTIKKSKIKIKDFLLVLFFFLVALISLTISPVENNVTSFALLTYFLMAYLFSNDDMPYEDFQHLFRIYWYCLIGVMLFGIYQFWAYLLNLPFQELEILQKVESFNTTNIVGVFNIKRVHSICLEPSIFSQLCALGVLLTFVYCKKESVKWILTILFGISIILSFSGTGIILLAVFMAVYFFKINDKINKKIAFVVIAIATIIIVIVIRPDVVSYMLNRLNEFSKDNSSGSIRFVQPYKIMLMTFSNCFLGIGPGNNTFAGNYFGLGNIMVTAGYAKVGIEYGILGLIFFIAIYCFVIKKYKGNNSFLVIGMIIYLILLNFLNDFFLQSHFWILLIVMNSFQCKNNDYKLI